MRHILLGMAFGLIASVSQAAFRTDWLQNTSSSITVNGTTYTWNAGAGGAGKFLRNVNGVITSETPAGGGGGGGTSSLEVFSNFSGLSSSPTASIGMSDAFYGTVTDSTFTFAANSSSMTLLGQYPPFPNIAGGTNSNYLNMTGPVSFGHIVHSTNTINYDAQPDAASDMSKIIYLRALNGTKSRVLRIGGVNTYDMLIYGPPSSDDVRFSHVTGTTILDRLIVGDTGITASTITATHRTVMSSLSPGVAHIVAGSSIVTTGTVSLTSEVDGILPIVNGGTGISTTTITSKSMNYVEPDLLALVTSTYPLVEINSWEYPSGITLASSTFATASASTCTYRALEYTSPTDTTPTVLSTMTTTNSAETNSNTFSDYLVAAGSWIFIEVDPNSSGTCDVTWARTTLWYRRN